MDERLPSIWNRPWRSPAKVFAWFALLFGVSLVIIYCIGLLTDSNSSGTDLAFRALLASIILAVLVPVGLLLIRWLSSWRNFRRLLFGILCLIGLVLLAYAEENWRGKHAWKEHVREWESKGEKFDFVSQIPPPVPDEQNFALTPMLKAVMDFTSGPRGTVWHDTNGMARLDKMSAELPSGIGTNDHLVRGSLEKGTFADLASCAEFYRGNTNYPQAAATAEPAEVILVALGKFAAELNELRAAAASRPSSRYPIQYAYEPSWGILLPHLARIKGLTMLTQVRATAELDTGRTSEAFDDLKLGFRLSDSIRAEPILIDHLVRVATLAINLQTVREGLLRRAWSEPQLAEIEKYMVSVDVLAEYKLAMRGERALSTSGMDYMRRQGLWSQPLDYLASEEGSSASAPPLNPMPSGWFYQNMVTFSRIFQEFIFPAVDERLRRVSVEVSDDGGRACMNLRTGPYTILAKMTLPALEKAVRKSARMQSYVDSTRVACALERFRLADGKLPARLDALVPAFIDGIPTDVIDGKPLRYRRSPDGGFVLYSVGWNKTDDGGQLAWLGHGKSANVDVAHGDWVWQMSTR